MRSFLLALAAASSLVVAVSPAAAQPQWDRGEGRQYDNRDRGDHDRGRGYGQELAGRIQDLGGRIDDARRDGRISPVTAQHLRRQVQELRQLAADYSHDRMVTPSERATLERKYDYISSSITKLARMGDHEDRRR